MSILTEKITLTLESKSTLITLELLNGRGTLRNRSSVFHFNQTDKMNDIVGTLSLLWITERINNLLLSAIEEWLEEA